nr:ankyrin repeat domain-containing protein [Streptomyces chartreusis]
MGDGGLDDRLRSAVRAGDAEAVRDLLDEGADPNTLDADGLPLLCVAVAAYDEPVAAALVEGGSDPDLPLPDGTTPLWRAVDGGSAAVFSAVLGREPRLRIPEPDRDRLLAFARGRYETGAAEELRRRTGATGPATTVRVQDDEYDWVEQVSLGGLVVRAGHGAILTSLEWAFRVLTPVDELIARAVAQPDSEHVDWSTVRWILAQRRSFETWSAVVAHRHRADPKNRRFVLDYLRTREFIETDPHHVKKDSDLLAGWAAEETDAEMLAMVLDIYTGHDHPDQEAIGLRHAGHPDPAYAVRCRTPYARRALPARPRPGPRCSPSCGTIRTGWCVSERARRACGTTRSSRRPSGPCCYWPRTRIPTCEVRRQCSWPRPRTVRPPSPTPWSRCSARTVNSYAWKPRTVSPSGTTLVPPMRSSGWGRSAPVSSTTIERAGCGGGNGGRRPRTASDGSAAVIRWNGATGRHYRAADPSSPGEDVPLYTV